MCRYLYRRTLNFVKTEDCCNWLVSIQARCEGDGKTSYHVTSYGERNEEKSAREEKLGVQRGRIEIR